MAEQLKPYVDYLISEGIKREDGAKLIKDCDKLSREEKNLIYAYVYPRPLGDRELPARVQKFRAKEGIPMSGTLKPSTLEAALIVEAERTEQYKKFIHHLIYAFSDPTKIFPISGNETSECSICGKVLYEKDLWDTLVEKNPDSPEKTNREYLSFGSTESSVTLCADCLIQLIHASTLLESINPDYLSWWKNSLKNRTTWDDLKL